MHTIPGDHLVGQWIGEYHIESLVGRGQLTAVYRAQHSVQNTLVALTVFLIPGTFSSQERIRFMQRFQKEASTLIALRHEHILPISDYGEYRGFPYLVMPSPIHGSLATHLKQHKRYTDREVLTILEQIVAGTAYAHSQGRVHGALQPSNILLHEKHTLLIASFGLREILQLRGVASRDHPYAHLLSIAETFLFAPEYIAPEMVQGQPADPRSDIYALGILAFELLSGSPAFTGTDAFAIARQHVQQPIPSLRLRRPDLPTALLSVMNQVLVHDPALRFQHASEFIEAFAQEVRAEAPFFEWERRGDEEQQSTRREDGTTTPWQIIPPIITGKMAAISPSQSGSPSTKQMISPQRREEDRVALPVSMFREKDAERLSDIQPIGRTLLRDNVPLSPATRSGVPHYQPPFKPSHKVKRRRMIALLALGGVVVAGAMLAEGVNLVRMNSSPSLSRTISSSSTPGIQSMHNGNGGQADKTKQQSEVEHTGTIIGSLNMPFNTSIDFLNPATQQRSLLIHLPSGEFVAYEKVCSPQGAQVSYNTETHTLVCPSTQSVFDPANNGVVLQGPPVSPLKEVMVRVNRDGTITTG